MDAIVNTARWASQTDPNSGVDPYNTADAQRARAQIDLDFAQWCKTWDDTALTVANELALLKRQAE